MGNVQALPNETCSRSMNCTLSICPSFDNVISSVGTFSPGNIQTVGMFSHYYSRAYETSDDKYREKNTSDYSTLDCFSNYVKKENANLIKLIRSQERKMETTTKCLTYRPEISRQNSTCLSYTPEPDWWMDLHCSEWIFYELNSKNAILMKSIHIQERKIRKHMERKTKCLTYRPEISRRNSTAKESINILEQERRKCVDDVLFGLGNGTRNERVSSTPEMCSRMDLLSTPTNFSESNSDLIDDVSEKELQSSITRSNFQSSQDEYLNGSTNSFWTICPICNNVMSFAGTHSCEISQIVGTSLQLYLKPCETSSDQNKSRVLLTEIVNSTFKESIQFLEHDTIGCVDDIYFGLGNGTRNECVSSTPETCSRMDLHSTPTNCSESYSDNSTFKKLIQIREHETSNCDDDASFCSENENEYVGSPPEKSNRTELHLIAESTCDRISNMSKKELQSSPDEFRLRVKRGSHVMLHRDKFSYDHHMLVCDVNEDSIRFIEYSFPESTIDRINILSETSLGQVQLKTITFEELFQPNASKVYLVYNECYPLTTEELNTAMERATSRIGETMYSISHSNCEHFVTWALAGNSTSGQWRDAGSLRRGAADGLDKIVPVFVANFANLLLQNDPPNKDSFDLSPPEDKTIKKSKNDTVAPNQNSSILRTIIRRLAAILLLLKLVLVCIIWGLRPGRHNLMIFAIVVFRSLMFFFGPRFQVLEIDKLVFQNFQNFMSVEDTFREAFKILGIYCLWMIRLSRSTTCSDTLVLCFCQLLCYILAGILFDVFIYPLFYFLLTL